MLPSKSILPESLRAKLANLGGKLEQQIAIGDEFEGIVGEMNNLQPSIVVRADSEIAYTANLQKWRRQFPLVVRLFSPRIVDIEQLDQVPELKYLFIFHRDGHIREAALKRITSPIPSAFLFAAIAWRLNDWVSPVRMAAAECALRCFPVTPAVIVAEAALSLLAREYSWGRWMEEKSALAFAYSRPDVADALARLICTRRTGPMATVLRYALKDSGLDRYLEMLAHDALQPAVRATAFQALIDGYAVWPNGWDWHWVNKPMGISRRQTSYSKRPLAYSAERVPLIKASACDPSPIVRRVAASSLIRYELEFKVAEEIAIPLLADKSPSVRVRAEFYFKRTPA